MRTLKKYLRRLENGLAEDEETKFSRKQQSFELEFGWRVESNQQMNRVVVTMCHESRVELRAAQHRQPLQQAAQLQQAVLQQQNDSKVTQFQIVVSRE